MSRIRQNYARLVLTRGVNLQPGQILVIDAPVWTSEFVHLVSEEAVSYTHLTLPTIA